MGDSLGRGALLHTALAALLGTAILGGSSVGSADGEGAASGRASRSSASSTEGQGVSTGGSDESSTPASGPIAPRALLGDFDPREHRAEGELRVADLADGRRAVLTLDPALQSHLEERLEHYEVPHAGVVAIAPATGRVLAYVSHSQGGDGEVDMALDAQPPAASVFKIVSAAALLGAGISPEERVCYGGGASRLVEADLRDDPRRDTACATLSDALGRSLNAVFAKLADRHLDAARLRRYAEAFGFGHALPFDVPTRASHIEVPADRLERARAAAGFWHSHLSPLHGALLAATIANGGVMPHASIVDRVEDAEGRLLHRHAPADFRPVVPRATARALTRMMVGTVARGTARGAFHDPAGNPFLPNIEVAGKTGTLHGSRPYRAYTWWVGFAPAEAPTIAVAALVVNTPRWRIKASYVAREALRRYLLR